MTNDDYDTDTQAGSQEILDNTGYPRPTRLCHNVFAESATTEAISQATVYMISTPV